MFEHTRNIFSSTLGFFFLLFVSLVAPCTVSIQRGRILYKEKKMWIADFQPNVVLHKETVSVYCMDKDRKCGYAMSTQCIDGTLKIPECFEGNKHFITVFFFVVALLNSQTTEIVIYGGKKDDFSQKQTLINRPIFRYFNSALEKQLNLFTCCVFVEPSAADYVIHASSLPSEIEQC